MCRREREGGRERRREEGKRESVVGRAARFCLLFCLFYIVCVFIVATMRRFPIQNATAYTYIHSIYIVYISVYSVFIIIRALKCFRYCDECVCVCLCSNEMRLVLLCPAAMPRSISPRPQAPKIPRNRQLRLLLFLPLPRIAFIFFNYENWIFMCEDEEGE